MENPQTTSGFGGPAVSLLAAGTQDRRPKPSDFSSEKIPQHAFLRRGSTSKAICSMSQICGM
jgi:hypothetical protein